MDLLAAFDEQARRFPDRLAQRSGERSMTYAELSRRAGHLAAWLSEHVTERGAPVAIIGHKEPEMLVAFLGCCAAGHPYVPIDISVPAQRIERIVSTAAAALTLTPERVAFLSDGDRAAPALALSPDAVLYIMFTSGSTGEPKGVPITRAAVGGLVDWLVADHQPVAGQEVFLDQAIYSFDLSVMDIWPSLATGGTLFSLRQEDLAEPKRMYQVLAGSGVTIWVSTPSFAQLCLAERTFDQRMLPQVRRFLFCGETLAPETARQLLNRFPGAEVWNTYGPTEATVATTGLRIDREVLARYASLPVGRPMPGSRVFVADEQFQPLAEGQRGQLVIAGPHVSPGYLHRPDLNAQAFFTSDGLPAYRTGDWGHQQDGLLFFEGRMDGQIKLHGHRLELGDIEANLCALAGVAGAAIVPVIKDGRPQFLVGFVVLTARPALSDFEIATALREQLGQRVAAYMVPRRFTFLDAFPMTPNGKIDRRALAAALP